MGAQLAAPVMRPATGLHRHHAPRLRCEKLQKLLTRDATAEHRRTRLISPMRMENLLCDIQTDHANFCHGRLLSDGWSTPPSWHIDAVGGVHPITHSATAKVGVQIAASANTDSAAPMLMDGTDLVACKVCKTVHRPPLVDFRLVLVSAERDQAINDG